MDVGVFLHVGLLVEPFSAELARVRPRVGVDEQVRWQGRRSLEALAALTTFEASLGAVDGPVLTETDCVAERLPTRAALVRPSTTGVRTSSVYLHTCE